MSLADPVQWVVILVVIFTAVIVGTFAIALFFTVLERITKNSSARAPKNGRALETEDGTFPLG
jgi:hypothetical protein